MTGDFIGHVEYISSDCVRGWACDRRHPNRSIEVEVLSNGIVVGRTLADTFRKDLQLSGFGDGRHGFELRLQSPLARPETVSARAKGSLRPLINDTPEWLRHRSRFQNSLAQGFPAPVVGATVARVAPIDVAIAVEMQQAWQRLGGNATVMKISAEPNNMWSVLVESHHGQLVDLLDGTDPHALGQFLVDLQKTGAAHGIMQGRDAYEAFIAAGLDGVSAALAPFQDGLASLAIYLGIVPEECPEQGPLGEVIRMSQETLRHEIEGIMGHPIVPPPIFDWLYGLRFDAGVLHLRDIQALYATLRAFDVSRHIQQPHICEIGGGFGQVAYYAFLRGARRYTLVDLPTVAFMQYFCLRRYLPDTRIALVLPGDPLSTDDGINIVLSAGFADYREDRYDIILNCDSFPEMGDDVCRRYFEVMRTRAPLFLSINQEAHELLTKRDGPRQTIVGRLARETGLRPLYRFRSWIRKGYVEELFALDSEARDEFHSVS